MFALRAAPLVARRACVALRHASAGAGASAPRGALAVAVGALGAVSLGMGGVAACEEDHQSRFAGQFAATLTEFGDDGCATVANVERYAAHLKAQGCVGVFVNGTSAESMSLSMAERKLIAEAWKRCGDARDLKVIVHVGSDVVREAEELAAHSARLGVDGISAMAPRFFKCATAEALVDYCAGVARFAPLTPFFYYHFPNATGCSVKPSALLRAAKDGRLPTLAGMKFSDCDMWEYGDACDADPDAKLAFLPGFEAQTLAYLPYHPRDKFGSISLSFSVLAPLHATLTDAFYAGDAQEASEHQALSRAFFRTVTPFGWTQSVKFALFRSGVFDSPLVRAPLPNLSNAQRDQLAHKFDNLHATHGAPFAALRPKQARN